MTEFKNGDFVLVKAEIGYTAQGFADIRIISAEHATPHFVESVPLDQLVLQQTLRYWKINACIPGLNIPFYICCPERPTHEQVQAVWLRKNPKSSPLKSPEESSQGPLRDAYPAYVSIEEVEVHAP